VAPSSHFLYGSAVPTIGVGNGVGAAVGDGVGAAVGDGVGAAVGYGVGAAVGYGVGAAVGYGVGAAVGYGVGAAVGYGVGAAVGASVAGAHSSQAEQGTIPHFCGHSWGIVLHHDRQLGGGGIGTGYPAHSLQVVQNVFVHLIFSGQMPHFDSHVGVAGCKVAHISQPLHARIPHFTRESLSMPSQKG